MRIVIAGGGTGGHVYPGIAVADALKRRRPDVEIVFVGTRRGVESRIVPRHGYELRTIPARGLLGSGLFGKITGLAVLAAGFVRSYLILRRLKPGAVLATGGFVSAPAGLAARVLGIPLVVQEQNSVPGATNRLLANFAAEVHLNFAAARMHLRRKDNLRLTGNPLRSTVGSGNRILSLEHFGLDPNRRTVFVFGGSRGAATINVATAEAARELDSRSDVQFIIQTGKPDYQEMREKLSGLKLPLAVRPYLMQIEEAYAAADLIVCRSGAMTLSEVVVCGLPSVLIPYPHAAQDHQVKNAQEMVEAGAAEMILDGELTGAKLARVIVSLLQNPRRLREMSSNAFRMARFDASEKLASSLERLAEAREKAPAADEAQPPAPAPLPPRGAPPRGEGGRRDDAHRKRRGRRGGARRGAREGSEARGADRGRSDRGGEDRGGEPGRADRGGESGRFDRGGARSGAPENHIAARVALGSAGLAR